MFTVIVLLYEIMCCGWLNRSHENSSDSDSVNVMSLCYDENVPYDVFSGFKSSFEGW